MGGWGEEGSRVGLTLDTLGPSHLSPPKVKEKVPMARFTRSGLFPIPRWRDAIDLDGIHLTIAVAITEHSHYSSLPPIPFNSLATRAHF